MKYIYTYIIELLFLAIGIFFTSEALALNYCSKNNDEILVLKTVVIDPGHGGHDSGCLSKDGSRIKEKDIALSISQKLARKIRHNFPEVKVVLTRSDDRFIKLNDRAAIANKNNADLFISIHVNALDPKITKHWSTVRGFSIHTLGQSRVKGRDLFSFNMDVCKRENSVIKLEDDYTTTYQGFDPNDPESFIFFNLMQNSNLTQSLIFAEEVNKQLLQGPIPKSRGIYQDPFLVLWKTTMPAVLVECGFISNKYDLAALKSSSGQDKIAYRLYKAFASYKKKYDITSVDQFDKPKEEPRLSKSSRKEKPSSETTSVRVTNKNEHLYGTQVIVSSRKMNKNDKFFKGQDVLAVPYKHLYKYIIGFSKNRNEAEKKFRSLKKQFKDSYMVEIVNGQVKRLR